MILVTVGAWRRLRPMALTLNALVARAPAFARIRFLLTDDPAVAPGLLLYLILHCAGW